MIKAVIVDDEIPARETLEGMLSRLFPEIHVAGQAGTVEEALKLIPQILPTVVFLDIKMPDGTGFDLLKRLEQINFRVIFTTAFSEYALPAIKFSAFDYLVKPIDTNELRETITRLIQQPDLMVDNELKLNALQANLEFQEQTGKKIVLKTIESMHLVNLDQIIRCEADDNYTWVYLKNQPRLLLSKPLKHFDDMLSGYGFFRVHQSHLVNVHCICRIDKTDGGVVVLSDQSNVPIAVRKREALFHLLERL